MFDKFENRYMIRGVIKTETAIHIGGRNNELKPSDIDNHVVKDIAGRPLIPGSSIKGVLRSFLERILLTKGEKVCMLPDNCLEKFNSKDDRTRLAKESGIDAEDADYVKKLSGILYDKACPVCKLMGSNLNAAKLMIKDAKVINASFTGYEKRDGVGINRDTNTSRQGCLYNYEVVPRDVEFDFEAVGENLQREDIGNMIILLSAMKDSFIQIGGKTSRGLGRFILKDIEIEKIDGDNIVDAILYGNADKMDFEYFKNNFLSGEGKSRV